LLLKSLAIALTRSPIIIEPKTETLTYSLTLNEIIESFLAISYSSLIRAAPFIAVTLHELPLILNEAWLELMDTGFRKSELLHITVIFCIELIDNLAVEWISTLFRKIKVVWLGRATKEADFPSEISNLLVKFKFVLLRGGEDSRIVNLYTMFTGARIQNFLLTLIPFFELCI
jgi:hypothetical protein